MAKKAKSKKAAVSKKPARPAPKKVARPQGRKRRVALGLPSTATKTVEAGEPEGKSVPPAESSKPAVAGGDTATLQDGGSFAVTVVRVFTEEEVGAILNMSGFTESTVEDIGQQLIEFVHRHIDEAVAEDEADTISEKPRYQEPAPMTAEPQAKSAE